MEKFIKEAKQFGYELLKSLGLLLFVVTVSQLGGLGKAQAPTVNNNFKYDSVGQNKICTKLDTLISINKRALKQN